MFYPPQYTLKQKEKADPESGVGLFLRPENFLKLCAAAKEAAYFAERPAKIRVEVHKA